MLAFLIRQLFIYIYVYINHIKMIKQQVLGLTIMISLLFMDTYPSSKSPHKWMITISRKLPEHFYAASVSDNESLRGVDAGFAWNKTLE